MTDSMTACTGRSVRRFVLGALALALVAPPALARADQTGPSTPRITPALIAEIEALMPQAMADFDVPGAALALVEDGQVVYARGFGVRDLASGAPFTADTIHRIGSTTKSMTSMLNAIYVDRGLYGWDTPVQQITPLFRFPEPELTQTVTVRQLMGMGTGLGQSEIELYLDLQSPWQYLRTLATLPILAPPQTIYFYNDYVYASAGHLGALKQGTATADLQQAYADAMKRELFDPIGMPTSAVTDDPTGLSDNVSRSYGYDLRLGEKADEAVVPYQPVRLVSPAGATATSVNEMARYLVTQMNGGVTPDGRRLVASDVLAETWKPQTKDQDVANAYYAMGWLQITDANGIPYLWHTGSVDGFKTEMTRLTDANIGILLFGNAEMGETLHKAVRGRIVELLYNLPAAAVAAQETAYAAQKAKVHNLATAVTAYQVPAEAAAPILGCYAKGWTVEYLDGLPQMTRKAGAHLVLLPTAQGYIIGSGTVSDGFGYAVAFTPDAGGRMHLRMTDPANNGALVDEVARCRSDATASND